MLIGQERAGKTSLKKSLKGEEFDPNEPSTIGVDIGPSVCKVTTELLKAEETGLVETEMSFSGVPVKPGGVEAILKQQDVTGLGESGENHGGDGFNGNTAEAADKLTSQDMQHSSQQGTTSEIDSDGKSVKPVSEIGSDEKSVNTVSEIGNNAAPASEEINALIKKLEKKELDDDCEIYCTIWDFAGQSVYYATHRLFLTYSAIYLLVHNLSLDPHGATESLIRQGLFGTFEDKNLVMTNFDFLDFWLTSIASLMDSEKVIHNCSFSLPPAIFVCTHADAPFENKTPKELANQILGHLRRKPYKNHLVGDCYVVNNHLSGKDAEVKRLLKKIRETAHHHPQFQRVIPRRWHKYELTLKAAVTEGYDCLKLSEARQIADELCSITDEEELDTLLDFLHDQRIVLYFRGSADPLIVLNLQQLVDIFKEVITVKPFEENGKFEEDWRDLEDKGKLSRKLLEHMWKELLKKQKRYTVEALVLIMEKFSFICRWPSVTSSQAYLVPHMLKSRSSGSKEGNRPSSSVPSLFVRFPESQNPLDLFPHLIVCLIDKWNKAWYSEEEPKIYRDFVKLFLGSSGDSVTLLCHLPFVEIVFNTPVAPPAVLKGVCPMVCSVLREALECLILECFWLKAKSCELCVLCPVCCKGLKRKSDCRHGGRNCLKEECLHFYTETELQGDLAPVMCRKSLDVEVFKVDVQEISVWFSKVSVKCDIRGVLP